MSLTEIEDGTIRVVIVDDHVLFREGLRILIENQPNMILAGEATTGDEALAVIRRSPVDIILLDIDLGGKSGLSCMPELLASANGAKVIMLTGMRDPESHRLALMQGAMGLVLKEQAAAVLIKAIEKVHGGEVWLDRSRTAGIFAALARAREGSRENPEAAKIASLTEREREVVTLVAQGLNRRKIAGKLFISEATVRNHLTSILDKLDLSDRFDLALYAYRNGLARPPV